MVLVHHSSERILINTNNTKAIDPTIEQILLIVMERRLKLAAASEKNENVII